MKKAFFYCVLIVLPFLIMEVNARPDVCPAARITASARFDQIRARLAAS